MKSQKSMDQAVELIRLSREDDTEQLLRAVLELGGGGDVFEVLLATAFIAAQATNVPGVDT